MSGRVIRLNDGCNCRSKLGDFSAYKAAIFDPATGNPDGTDQHRRNRVAAARSSACGVVGEVGVEIVNSARLVRGCEINLTAPQVGTEFDGMSAFRVR